ncbi:hypothetical protein ACP275_09G146600 [Erythranthe tilingii]
MEQLPSGGNGIGSMNNSKRKKSSTRRLASPQELVAHYEKQGMDTQEASLKVIQELQGAVFKMMTSDRSRNRSTANNSPEVVTSAKLDAIHARLLQLEMKIDSKPSYPQALALGVASSGIFNAALQLWNSVRQSTSSSNSS